MGEEKEEKRGLLLSLSELSAEREREFTRRAELLARVESGEEESFLRDVTLSVRKSVEDSDRVMVGSSSVMLSLVSEYFTAMFEGDSSKGETLELSDKITLPGIRAINALAFGALSSVEVRSEHLASLIAAAQYCKVPALTELCNEFIRRNDAMNDISVISKLLSDLNSLGFTRKSDGLIDQLSSNTVKKMFLDPIALTLPSDLFSTIVRSDRLAISEEDIWFRCVDWAQQQSTDDSILSALLEIKPHIRFPLMSEQFIITQVQSSRILSAAEYLRIGQVKYGTLDDSSLFCGCHTRDSHSQIAHAWDPRGIFPDTHSLSEDQAILTHSGEDGASNAFVCGIVGSGAESVEFEHIRGDQCFYGVMQATQQPKNGEYFGYPLRGLGYAGDNGDILGPSVSKPFGEALTKGDRLRVTVEFSGSAEATLSFHKNGRVIGHSVPLDRKMDLSQGVRFAVQTFKQGDCVRICPHSAE